MGRAVSRILKSRVGERRHDRSLGERGHDQRQVSFGHSKLSKSVRDGEKPRFCQARASADHVGFRHSDVEGAAWHRLLKCGHPGRSR